MGEGGRVHHDPRHQRRGEPALPGRQRAPRGGWRGGRPSRTSRRRPGRSRPGRRTRRCWRGGRSSGAGSRRRARRCARGSRRPGTDRRSRTGRPGRRSRPGSGSVRTALGAGEEAVEIRHGVRPRPRSRARRGPRSACRSRWPPPARPRPGSRGRWRARAARRAGARRRRRGPPTRAVAGRWASSRSGEVARRAWTPACPMPGAVAVPPSFRRSPPGSGTGRGRGPAGRPASATPGSSVRLDGRLGRVTRPRKARHGRRERLRDGRIRERGGPGRVTVAQLVEDLEDARAALHRGVELHVQLGNPSQAEPDAQLAPHEPHRPFQGRQGGAPLGGIADHADPHLGVRTGRGSSRRP